MNTYGSLPIFLSSKNTKKLLLYRWYCFLFSNIAISVYLFCISLATLMNFGKGKASSHHFQTFFSSFGFYRDQWLVLIIFFMYTFLFLIFSNKLLNNQFPFSIKKEGHFHSESKTTLSIIVLAKGCDMSHHPLKLSFRLLLQRTSKSFAKLKTEGEEIALSKHPELFRSNLYLILSLYIIRC